MKLQMKTAEEKEDKKNVTQPRWRGGCVLVHCLCGMSLPQHTRQSIKAFQSQDARATSNPHKACKGLPEDSGSTSNYLPIIAHLHSTRDPWRGSVNAEDHRLRPRGYRRRPWEQTSDAAEAPQRQHWPPRNYSRI